jgi:hypothetical protein
MLPKIKNYILISSFSLLPLCMSAAPVQLTDITVFSADSTGTFFQEQVWETRPNENFVAWIQQGESGGPFLTGPANANAQPNISLSSGANGFRLLATQALSHTDTIFGINLFFNNSLTPSISAYATMRTNTGSSSFVADHSTFTPATDWSPSNHAIPAAGTLSCVIGNQQITLTDFFWAAPSVYGLDSVGTYTTGADGQLDYVGGINLSVATVPEPGTCTLVVLALAGYFSLARRFKVSC